VTSSIQRHDGVNGERVYRLPLRVFPGLEANAYVLVDGDYHCLIDTGSFLPDSLADLEAGFAALREGSGEAVSFASLSRVVMTHGHLDHYGGYDFVRRHSAAPVAMHAYDRRAIEDPRAHYQEAAFKLRGYFRAAGIPEAQLEKAMALYHGANDSFQGGPVETVLRDGDLLDGRLQVVHAPGHCAGQVCLQLGDLLFTADHVLPDTFPHLAPEASRPWEGVGHYLAALDRVEALPGVRLALPGHGTAIARLGDRINQLRVSNQRKLARVLEAAAQPRTLLQLTEEVYPRIGPFHGLLALEKVGAYVEYLERAGQVAIAGLDGHAVHYQRVRASTA
jgi:glyoxylase-like metal-dependent hydrolase (beta-lactamase superfamily II)